MAQSRDTTRLARLKKTFDIIISGKTAITPHNSLLFLESIYVQPDAVSCVTALTTSPKAIDALRASMRYDTKAMFLNGPATLVLSYLMAPELQDIQGGQFLEPVLRGICEPPIFWSAFCTAFKDGTLEEPAQVAFASLLLALLRISANSKSIYYITAEDPAISKTLSSHSNKDVRNIYHRIKHVLSLLSTDISKAAIQTNEVGPGGRHDNDFADFRKIAILPTGSELEYMQRPFLRLSSALDEPETEANRVQIFLDNQFRLLREDMLYEMREELQIALGKKRGRHRGFTFDGLSVIGLYRGSDERRRTKWGIQMALKEDLPVLKAMDTSKKREAFFKSDKGKRYFRHQSMACLFLNGEIAAFPVIHRDEALLARNPPVVVLQFGDDDSSIERLLLRLKTAENIKIIQIDTAVFSYEPVLKVLQNMRELPLSDDLLYWHENKEIGLLPTKVEHVVSALQRNPKTDLKSLIGTSKSIILDGSQASSLLSGLTQKVSLIQGPPGTGKSFIGSLLARTIHDHTEQSILVVCYTNHALDQFLEDLMDMGIPSDHMVRIGGKSTDRTEHLLVYKQTQNSAHRLTRSDWDVIDGLKSDAEDMWAELNTGFEMYQLQQFKEQDLLEYLEFEEPTYYAAFLVPASADGSVIIDKKGKPIQDTYLLHQWIQGWGPGVLAGMEPVSSYPDIWGMEKEERRKCVDVWKSTILRERVGQLAKIGTTYNDYQVRIDRKFNESVGAVLASKRIIGCTTTAAAKYVDDLRSASPDVLLVEEAGEILESHVIAALGPRTKQMILIGDHKQLRPKVSNYALTVEKGDGYDLNRSLFERLVLKGYPHQTLTMQHRMRPEISHFVRALTYPDLIDAPRTQGRPNLRGVRDNVVFINHSQPEDNAKVSDAPEVGAKSSKQNTHEAEMALKIVRYLAQQGYGSDKLVVLTPYLGQLSKLRETLKKENDVILNDLDTFDLVAAGLLTQAAGKMRKSPLRLATIDNYQGEESEVVVISLTRSNPNNDIGFMFSPERLNVLLSRARNAMIIIGNADTFKRSKKGGQLWTKFLDLMLEAGHIYDGLPAQCERHPHRTVDLTTAAAFDVQCPDGGCTEPCGVKLSCGLHACPSRCHARGDHSQMKCMEITFSHCPVGHQRQWKCHEGAPKTCKACDEDARRAAKKQQEEYERQQRLAAEEADHKRKMDELEEQLQKEIQAAQDSQAAQDRANAVKQKLLDISAAASLRLSRLNPVNWSASTTATTSHPSRAPPPQVLQTPTAQAASASSPIASKSSDQCSTTKAPEARKSSFIAKKRSPARDIWLRQKSLNGEQNDAIDGIMSMIGLEEVKEQFLKIKAKVEVTRRQGTNSKQDRYNVSLLGNPGTGKTTVARLYAKFLASMQILPGTAFEETTGSSLAGDGVDGAKKMVERVKTAGGGTIFIDEAYQLTSEHSYGGRAVLDYLLAEMENNVGKVVFIVAGYNKEMESFFEHNPGLMSRVPYKFQFADYDDGELLEMLEKMIHDYYQGRAVVEGGVDGLYMRIAIRRIGNNRGRPGFGNARDLANVFSRIRDRQAQYIANERGKGKTPNDFKLRKEDIIGPDPALAVTECEAWQKLQSLIGLKTVKATVRSLMDGIAENYKRELAEKKVVSISLNRVFLGNPGTGKTTVAKLYGRILVDLGLLSNGEVIVKNPADFIGSALGESEKKTKAILATTVGKVLIIDEAYGLYGGGGSNDIYKTAVIDTIVAEVQGVPGEDRCVLLLGYKPQMEKMFQNVNPGLTRRFSLEDAFNFEDFTQEQLLEILERQMKEDDLDATEPAKKVAMDVLERARNKPNFGNAGDVNNILTKAKNNYRSRIAHVPSHQRPIDMVFEPQDFDLDYNRHLNASANLETLFKDVVGCDEIVEKLRGYQRVAQALKARGMDARAKIPMSFVFKGPPGTGKTTTARKMGQVFLDMGFLSSNDVVECSANDLVASYVGQTAPKTRAQFQKALGKVLFIDEAYRLAEGHFAQEAIDEIVTILTEDAFRGKMIVILAGYDQDINRLLQVNTGLSSRFPEEIIFRNLSPEECMQILLRQLAKENIDANEISDPSSQAFRDFVDFFNQLATTPSWGNARDVTTLSDTMVRKVYNQSASSTGTLVLHAEDALGIVDTMLRTKLERAINVKTTRGNITSGQHDLPAQSMDERASPPPPATVTTITAPPTAASAPKPKSKPKIEKQRKQEAAERDPGVSDEVWNQLQESKRAAERERNAIQQSIKQLQRNKEEAERKLKAQKAEADRLAAQKAADEAKKAELKRKQDEARKRAIELQKERDRIAAKEAAKRREEDQRRKREAEVQAKLRRMGVCVAGFEWIPYGGGYRCAGGSHFVSNVQLGL